VSTTLTNTPILVRTSFQSNKQVQLTCNITTTVKLVPFLKNERTYSMELQGAEHLLTPSRGRLNFEKMSLQTSTGRLSRLEVPKRGVKRPLVGLKALWHLNILNAIRKLLPLHLPFILQHTYGPTMVVPI
jgi:hypothetical protein